MRLKEWLSLGRVNGWGPTWHRDLPEVTPQSWAMLTPDPPSCFSFIVCTLAAAAGGARTGWPSASHPGWTCQRSAKESLGGLVSGDSTSDAQAHPSASSRHSPPHSLSLIRRHLEKLAGLGLELPHFATRSLGRATFCSRWRSQPRSSAFSGAWHLARAGYKFLGTHQLV